MTRLLSYFFVFAALGTTGCLARPPAPPIPERVGPPPEAMTTPDPAPNEGVVHLDVVGERAKVFEVTELTTGTAAAYGRKSSWAAVPLVQKKMRPLCITPCAVDLVQGWHSLVFESTTDEASTSTADITVLPQPIAVRHALGRDSPMSGRYLGGLLLLAPGVGLTFFGGIVTMVGAVSSPSVDASGRRQNDPKAFLDVGLVVLGVGAVLGITGGILMANNRPEKQPGSTIEWTLPAR
jgi:hypothetical protein